MYYTDKLMASPSEAKMLVVCSCFFLQILIPKISLWFTHKTIL